jgi:hypothetical protein
MVRAARSQSSKLDLLEKLWDIVVDQDNSMPDRDIIFFKILKDAIKEAKEDQSRPQTSSTRRKEISDFISKCLKVLSKGKDMATFVKQEELIL